MDVRSFLGAQSQILGAIGLAALLWASPSAAADKAPKFPAIPAQSAVEGRLYNFVVPAAVDPEGRTVQYSMTGRPGWLAFDAQTRQLTGTPPFTETASDKKPKKYKLKITGTDPAGKRATKSIKLSVSNGNPPPTLVTPLADMSAPEDAQFTITLSQSMFSDPQGEAFTVAVSGLPSWLTYNSSTRVLSGTPAQSHIGTSTVTVTATDARGASSSDTLIITVVNVNDAPRALTAPAAVSTPEDQLYLRGVFASSLFTDEDGDSLALSADALPGWLAFDASSGLVSGTPRNEHVGNHTYIIRGTDPSGASATQVFGVSVTNVNDAPTVRESLADRSVQADSSLTVQLALAMFADPDGDSLTLSVTSKPGFLSFSASTLVLSGTPAATDVGSHTVTVRGSDPSGAHVSDSFVVTVLSNNQAPVLQSPVPDQTATAGSLFVYVIPSTTFHDPDDSQLTYSVSGLPAWATFSAFTRTISGVPQASNVGVSTVTVTARDPADSTATDEFIINTRGAAGESAKYTVTGRIRAQTNSAVDSDTNDPNSPFVDNSTFSTAQPIGFNPAVIGGFVNYLGTGYIDDRFGYYYDEFDVYRMRGIL